MVACHVGLQRTAGTQGEGEAEQQGRWHLSDGGEDGEQDTEDKEIGLHGDQQPAPIESASTPPGSASSIRGKVVTTTCTNETSAAALGASTNSHCAPTVCPQVPIQLMNMPSQSQRKVRCARGAQAEESAAGTAATFPMQPRPPLLRP